MTVSLFAAVECDWTRQACNCCTALDIAFYSPVRGLCSGCERLSANVKICGLRSLNALEAAISAGASHFGVVFFPRSPRNIGLDDAAALVRAGAGRISSVALVVDADDTAIDAITRQVRPSMFQLHGAESPERVADIRRITGLPVIKAIGVAKPGDVERANAFREVADVILFDAKPPADGVPGGNGLAFDWRLLVPTRGKMPFMLSGGLTPDTVGEAIARTGAAIVDVSSGVESSPGVKDVNLIHSFVAAARMAHSTLEDGLWRHAAQHSGA
jgi:phosphoribosylanthranilate isomerase